MTRKFVLVAAVMAVGASWAVARGPDLGEKMNAIEYYGGGTGANAVAVAQANLRRGDYGYDRTYTNDRVVPAGYKEPAYHQTPDVHSTPPQNGVDIYIH